MPIPNRLNPVVPRISRWRVFSITLLLALFTPQINAAPVDTLTPISTARVYPAPVFEKPGDFNKSFVNILLIEQGSDIAGILIAGHTRIDVCRQLSRIMVEMYAELDMARTYARNNRTTLITTLYMPRNFQTFARAANVVHAHGESNGWKYVASRIVTPQSPSGGALPGPVLINIKVHDLQIK
ncbi:MAG: hypothetical protein KDK30_06905 [Leptospiraceae bacterium]|nr:hypothetical protein [Leptospiraceae bacterium]MCB1319426.1 hypothetical protein [Leptospiraceae bacterium]